MSLISEPITMPDSNGLLNEEDLNSEDDQSQAESLGDTLHRAFCGYTQNDSSDEEPAWDEQMDFDELGSQSGRTGFYGDQPDLRPQPQQGLPGSQPVDSRGKALFSRQGVNPIKLISDPRKHKAASKVLDAFSGPPKKRNPDHVKLKGTGWAMAQRVFSPSVEWPTKEVNAFIVKHLTLVPEQKKEFECDIVQESFFKDYEKVPGYKASFKFKNKRMHL